MRYASRAIAALVCALIASLTLAAWQQPIYAASANLIWKPYLQEISDTSVTIQWTTQSAGSSEVRYSTDASYSLIASASSRPLAQLGTQMHQAPISGLQPDTTYVYKIFTNGEDLWPEQTLTFRTAPSRGSSAPFTFAAFGDFGKNSDSQKRLRDQMARDSFRFLVTTGDNAYDAGRYSEFDTKVFQIYGDVFSKAAVFPTLGNHDYATSSGAPYLDLFSLPRNAWRASDHERYYSFDYGNLHVVALDTNAPLNVSDSAASDDMLDWLRDDLRRTTQPWVVAVVHHAPYSTGSHGSDSRVLSTLVPIFEQYNVDLVLSGHDHIYQRSKPLRGGQVSTVAQGGIVYVVSGAGSAADYGCGSATWLQIAYCGKTYGLYNRVHVSSSQLTVETVDEKGIVHDSFSLGQDDSQTAIRLPGRFEVEDYKAGGANVGYWDSSAGNSGGVYRTDDVDIQTCSDGAPCHNIAWVTAGEWLAYEVNVAQSGSYTVALRAATPYTGRSVHLELDGSPIGGPIAVPNTGSWQTWATVTIPPLTLPSGRHTLRLVADTSSLNLNYVVVSAVGGTPTPQPTSTATATSTSAPLPTSTPIPTNTPTPTSTPTVTPTSAPTESPTPTSAPLPTSTPTESPTPTSAPTTSPTPTIPPTSPPATSTPTPTNTPTPTSPPATSTPTPTNTPTPTSPPATSTPTPTNTPTPMALTFTANADARVEEANPGVNYGTSSTLRVDGGSDPDVESFLRFTVTGTTGTISSAKLRVYASGASGNGPAVYATGGGWTESGLTWNNRPARLGGALDDRGAVVANTWLEYNLGSLIGGDGTYNLLLATDNTDGFNLSSRQGSFPPQLVLTFASGGSPTPTPLPSAIPLPGRFEVEDYKAGGANVGYWDSSAGNSGGVYRSDDVDIQTCSDGAPCHNIAWVTAGEWLAYEVNVAQSGSYTVALRAATPNSGRSVHLELDGSPIGGPIPLPNTGSWQTWATVTTPPLTLPSGRHTLRLVADTSSLNLNSITVSAATSAAGPR
jgi:hypothetical protein